MPTISLTALSAVIQEVVQSVIISNTWHSNVIKDYLLYNGLIIIFIIICSQILLLCLGNKHVLLDVLSIQMCMRN